LGREEHESARIAKAWRTSLFQSFAGHISSFMTDQKEKARAFAELHKKGEPVVLYNVWDAGSAAAVARAGAKAVATGSWSVAAANGFADGEAIPLDLVLGNAARIASSVDIPFTLDFEGGYAAGAEGLARNIEKVIETGAVGINFEDQVVGGDGIYSIRDQTARIAAVRRSAAAQGVALFINARTDVFLKSSPERHADGLDEAIERAEAYADAGASGFFAPGLKEPELIKRLCDISPLPVNIMVMADTPSNVQMANLGVSRISYGPGPYRKMIAGLEEVARGVYGA
jgi:2-methylisocitrate lyase-like PEP mutase family enzyme